MGIAFRESLMVDLAPRFDDALLASLIPAWRALPYDHDSLEVMERIKRLRALPVIPAGDTDRVVVRSKDGALRVADVVRGWDRMPAMQRPRVERAEQLKAIIENQIVENRIRIESELPANLARPEVAGAIADRYEYHAVSGWLQHTIVNGIPTDSLTLLKHYRANPDEFTEAAKARAITAACDEILRELLGMGDLELAVRDRDNQTNLWDFAGFPIGLATDDSTSSIDLRPGTHSLSSVRDLNGGVQRQNLAARGSWAQSEAVYRNRETGATFGVVGDLSSLRWDRPYSAAEIGRAHV